MQRRSIVATLSLCLSIAACEDSGTTDNPDAGTDPGTCALTPALNLFATRCASSGCHGPGGQYPELTASGLPSWISAMSRNMANANERLVTPGSPETSWIYKKVTGMQGPAGGALMPLGAAMPISDTTILRDWIAAGAPSQCGTTDVMLPTDPNSLDQGALFSCSASASPASSVARLRRIDRPEWAHAIGGLTEASGAYPMLTAYQNPFSNQTGAPYSTYSAGVTVDTATLDLYFLNVPEAGWAWDQQFAYRRMLPVLNDATLRCMFNTAKPSDTCIDYYVDRFLTLGVLSRTPTAEERSRYRAYLVAGIAREPGGGDTTARKSTLDEAASAAWLTAGALFRSELGMPVAGDAAGRRRLTNEELALAIGSVLNTHRPGAPMLSTYTPSSPDDVMPANGWLQLVRAAAVDGSIQDPMVMRTLIAKYAGGVDATRKDLLYEGDTREIPARGEYWLAPRIAGFFREWLAYGSANSAFKDTPGQTSRFPTTSGQFDATTLSYTNLQNRYYGFDSTLVDQLDDTIARVVIESSMSKTPVFSALLTSRTWRLPSDLSQVNTQTCATSADCTMDPNYTKCTVLGLCGNSISASTTSVDQVYNLQRVPNTAAGRWVTMPAGERNGVLTHPAWLTAHGNNFEDDASLVHRGRWIRERLFCQSVPGLENVMVQAKLGPRGANLSARDRVLAATATGPSAPTCQGCHRLMNTLGLPFEIYNHAGFLRATDHGRAPNGTSTIDNLPDPALNLAVTNAVDFSQAIAGSQYAKRCFIRQSFRYFTGRDETAADSCTLAAMEKSLDQGSFFDMLGTLVTSDTFLYRSVDGGGK